MNINTQDANDLSIIALSAAANFMLENFLQIIPALVAVISMIFMIRRYYDDKKKTDLEIELMRKQIQDIETVSNRAL